VVLGRSMFVYRYHADHLLSFARQDLPVFVSKRILRDTLRGLAALHERNVVHTGKLGRHLLDIWTIFVAINASQISKPIIFSWIGISTITEYLFSK
jgi:hypothetical protein